MGHENQRSLGIPLGTVELFGSAVDKREHVIEIIKGIYRSFGFDPLNTPVMEHAEVFNGHHGEGEELLFFLEDSSSEKLVLRYDLTVPLARYISDHPQSPMPFKRYQVATVFRDDEVDKGHFREFTQCDGDVIGISDLTADAEVICMAFAGLEKLGFKNFKINVNHRRIINALAEKSNLLDKEGRLSVQRALDAISKFSERWPHHGRPLYLKSYASHIHSILVERALSAKAVEVIQEAFMVDGKNFDEKMSGLESVLKDFPEGLVGINELKEIVSYLPPVVKNVINLDLSLARGADYYTGFIIEGSILDVPVGAVLGGGRFDNLVKDLGGPDLPAVGMAFGLDRIMVALRDLGIQQSFKSTTRILVVPKQEQQKAELLDLTRRLRNKGIDVDFIPMFSKSQEEIEEYALNRGFGIIATTDSESGVKIKKIDKNDLFDLSLMLDNL